MQKINIKRIISFVLIGSLTLGFASCKAGEDSSSSQEPNGNESNTTTSFEIAKDASGKEIVLIENAQSDYEIVVPENKNVYENYAAKELQSFLAEATGCTLEIIADRDVPANSDGKYISVGKTKFFDRELTKTEYGESGGLLDVDGVTVYLAGAGGYGTLNMAYRFLEYEIGWEAYALTEIYYEGKDKLNLLAFEDYKYLPAFDYMPMQMGQVASSSSAFEAARLGFMPATGGGYTLEGNMYAAFLHNLPLDGMIGPNSEVGYEQIRKYCADEIAAYMTTERLETAYASLLAAWKENNAGEPTEAQVAEMQTTAEANVELEAVKFIKSGWYEGGNICMSRPEIVECATEIVKEKLLANPNAKYLMLGQGDNGASCNCDSCKEMLKLYGTQGGISIWFMNEISNALAESKFLENNPQINPDVKLLFLNYMAYETPPVTYDENGNVDKVLIKANANVGTYFCIYVACQHHALDDPNCSRNPSYFKSLKGWSKVSDTIGTYLYWLYVQNYFSYFDNWPSYQQWAEILSEYGVKYNFIHGVENYRSPFDDLRLYLMSKYFADPNAGDFDSFVRDFMNHYYKAASAEMYEYYSAIRLHVTAIQRMGGSQCLCCHDGQEGFAYMDPKWWSLETIQKNLEILNRAYEAVEASSYPEEQKQTLRDRILIEESTMRYYRYTFHESSYSAEERLMEKEWLTEVFEKLGVTRAGENIPISL